MPEHYVTFRIHGPTIARPAGAIDELRGMLCRVQVAAANASAERLDQHLTLARCGIFYVVNNDAAVAEDRSAHIGLLRVFGHIMGSVSRDD